jgi:Holliday junction resolvase RusA-like endonuclease
MTRHPLFFLVMGQPVTKKNSMVLIRHGQRVIPIPSKIYRDWLKRAKSQVSQQTKGIHDLPIRGPVHLKVLAYRWSTHKIDLSNVIEAVQDMIQYVGVLEDDSQVSSLDGSRVFFGVPKDEARVEITLEEV